MASTGRKAASARRGRRADTVAVSRDALLTVTATLLIVRCGLRRIMRCGSDVLIDWLMPIDDALREIYGSLCDFLDGDLDAGEDASARSARP